VLFGFQKTATAVIKPDTDRYLKSHMPKLVDIQIL
jgi:hypothetical protein